MKNKRLYALILLAALALLQVRVAFAGCIADTQARVDTRVTCCGGHATAVTPEQPTVAASPCAELCAQPYAAASGDQRALLHSQLTPFPPLPPTVSPLSASSPEAHRRLASATAHRAHTRLLYVLQRLLI